LNELQVQRLLSNAIIMQQPFHALTCWSCFPSLPRQSSAPALADTGIFAGAGLEQELLLAFRQLRLLASVSLRNPKQGNCSGAGVVCGCLRTKQASWEINKTAEVQHGSHYECELGCKTLARGEPGKCTR